MKLRTCKGPCGSDLPETEENFYFRRSSKNGKSYASSYCRPCEKSKSSEARRDAYSSADGREKILAQNKKSRDAHPEFAETKRIAQNHLYATSASFRERRKRTSKLWRLKNRSRKSSTGAAWHQRTKHRTRRKRVLFETFFPDLKLRGLVRKAVCEGMKLAGGSKAGRSVLRHLPYSMAELRDHLESLWEPWMSWSNYGPWERDRRTWQIDHVVPQAALPYDDFGHPNFLRCWALANLRPLEAVRNLSEGARRLV